MTEKLTRAPNRWWRSRQYAPRLSSQRAGTRGLRGEMPELVAGPDLHGEATALNPDLEVVQSRRGESFTARAHGYPFIWCAIAGRSRNAFSRSFRRDRHGACFGSQSDAHQFRLPIADGRGGAADHRDLLRRRLQQPFPSTTSSFSAPRHSRLRDSRANVKAAEAA